MSTPPTPTRRWKPALALALLLGLAAALRLGGITWGLPDETHLFSYHPDEYHSLRGLLALALGDPNPHFFNYGSLYLYLAASAGLLLHPAPGIEEWVGILTGGQAGPWLRAWTLDARLVSVLAGVLTVAVVYLLGRRLLGTRGGLIAAGLLAVLPLHVLLSGYATVDVTQTLFIAAALYLSLRAQQQGDWRSLLGAGACVGLAASTKYSGGAAIVAPLLAALLAPGPGGGRVRAGTVAGRWLAVGLAALAAFALTSPYTFLAWEEARAGIAYEMQHMREGEWLAVGADPSALWFHLRHLLAPGMGPVLLLGLAGAAWALARRERAWYPLLLLAAVWVAMTLTAQVRYPRYATPLAVPVALLAVVPLGGKWRGRAAWGGLLALSAAAGLAWSAQIGYQLTRPDPRDLALVEILARTDPHEAVGLVEEPWFHQPPVDYGNGGRALRRLPLWQTYHRPQRPLAVTGLDPTALRRELPEVYVTTCFDLGESLRAGQPQAEALLAALEQHYTVAATWGGRPLTAVPWPLGPDWRYPWPEITLWQRKHASAD